MKHIIGLVIYDDEIDEMNFQIRQTAPGIRIRMTEAAGNCIAMAQWFISKMTVRQESGLESDIDGMLAEAATPPSPLVKTCICGHKDFLHYTGITYCGIAGCICTCFKEVPNG